MKINYNPEPSSKTVQLELLSKKPLNLIMEALMTKFIMITLDY